MIKRFVFETEEDWLQHRKDQFTSSEVNRLMADPTKKQQGQGIVLSDGAISYILEKASAYFDSPKPVFFNSEMQWGKENEPDAAYTFCQMYKYDPSSNDVIYTSQGGFVFFTTGKVGGTPDMILPDGIVEFKCPNSDTHLYYKLMVNAKNIQSELPRYYDQMQTNMYLCERDKCYFMSFDPRFKNKDKSLNYNRAIHVVEVARDEERIKSILDKVEIAYDKLQQFIKELE